MTKSLHPFDQAVKFAGSEAALARLLNITPWALSKWNKDRIPERRCLEIQEATDGQVTAESLRPDINWEYVRQTIHETQVTNNQLAG